MSLSSIGDVALDIGVIMLDVDAPITANVGVCASIGADVVANLSVDLAAGVN